MNKILPLLPLLFMLGACSSVPGSLAKYKKLKPAPENAIPRSFLITQKGRVLIMDGIGTVQFVYQSKAKNGRAVYVEGLFAPNAEAQMPLTRTLEVNNKNLFVYDEQNALVESFTLEK